MIETALTLADVLAISLLTVIMIRISKAIDDQIRLNRIKKALESLDESSEYVLYTEDEDEDTDAKS